VHNNYYLLRQLIKELKPLLTNGIISECFTQNKEELMLRIELQGNSFFMKANLQPAFSCLSFPKEFHRAKRNSVDLFQACIGLTIENIREFKNERSFALQLSQHYVLLFKMHANRSNILLFKEEKCVALFRNNLEADENLVLSKLDRDIDWTEAGFLSNHSALKQHYFTLGKLVWAALESEGFSTFDKERQWLRLNELKKQLENPTYYISRWKNSLVLSLIPFGDVLKKELSAIEALNYFSREFLQSQGFERDKQVTLRQLEGSISNAKNYITKSRVKLHEVEYDQHYQQWGDLLMANLHTIKQGQEVATVLDFYNGDRPLELKLKRELSAQKNAEVFYRKAKNRQIEIDRLKKAIQQKEKEKENTEQKLKQVEAVIDLKELRKITQSVVSTAVKKENAAPLPYHEFTYQGFVIWVGRNAQANDVLTLKFSYKEDLWLHAKDVAGSHVLIKHQAGKAFPKEVIERAAELAAYNSKRKTDSLAPVAFTPKKFVRKRKGDPAGTVVVEKEEVILVQPSLPV
jgi:predicted ribosome quality control (RQC) complex YloA/Tae2 family protein